MFGRPCGDTAAAMKSMLKGIKKRLAHKHKQEGKSADLPAGASQPLGPAKTVGRKGLATDPPTGESHEENVRTKGGEGWHSKEMTRACLLAACFAPCDSHLPLCKPRLSKFTTDRKSCSTLCVLCHAALHSAGVVTIYCGGFSQGHPNLSRDERARYALPC